MTVKEIRSEVKRLVEEGKTRPEIANILAEKGITSTRTGGPYSASAISNILAGKRFGPPRKRRSSAAKAAKAANPVTARPKKASAILDSVRTVLGLPNLAADERIALAQLILN